MYLHRIVLFIFILVCHFNYPAFANNSSENLNPAEKYVIEQVKKGEVANFSEKTEEDRILSADFLKKLLTGGFLHLKVTEKGIIIVKARIKEKLDINKEKISFPVYLKCIFDKDISFSQTKFTGGASFSGAEFTGVAGFSYAEFTGGDADFSGAKFSTTANFSGAEFSSAADFSGAKFSDHADFSGAKFSLVTFLIKASLKGANLSKAYLREVYLSGADLSEADLSGADLSGADLHETNLSRANLREANLREANLSDANLSGAILIRAIMGETDLSRADLSMTLMNEAILIEALLSGTNLSGANLKQTDLTGAFFELKPKSLPKIQHIAFARNLSELTYYYIPRSLVELREQFKTTALRRQEREITYAIKRTQRKKLMDETNWISKIEGAISYVIFEWTCKYGMEYHRPLFILFYLIIVFTIPYLIVLKFPPKREGIWKVWNPDRVRKDLGSQDPIRLNLNLNLNFLSATGIGFYFSLLSAFGIGWRELNVGNWIARLHPREYTLRATGWVRTVSGLQSLISVYLLALWVLNFFARPFESF